MKKSDVLLLPMKMEEKLKLRKSAGYNYKRLFVSVGSFIERKGYDLFLNSLLINNNERNGYIIIGGGEEKEDYEDFLKRTQYQKCSFY